MKIFVTLATILTLSFSSAFAMDVIAQPKKEPKLLIKPGQKEEKKLNESKVENYDLNKLFAEAQAYSKAANAWKKLECKPKTGFICSKWECVRKDIKTTLIIDKTKQTISRCDDGQCDDYVATLSQNGVFYNVQTEGPVGTLIRILGDSRYKEISTVGLDAYIANGECSPIAE